MAQVHFAHSPVLTPEQVDEIVSKALSIAEDRLSPIVSPEAVFSAACRLLGLRASASLVEQPQALAVPRMDMIRGG